MQVWTATPDGRLDYVNSRLVEYAGRPAAELLGSGWQAILHPDDMAACLEIWSTALASGERYEVEVRLLDGGGAARWHITRAVPVRGADGKIAHWFGSNTDIDDAKRLQAELAASERRFHELADLVPQIVWTARPDGYLDYYNRRWYEFTATPPERYGDDSWKAVMHPDDVARCLDVWYRAVRTGEPYEIEYRLQEGRSSEYRWFLGRALPVRNQYGAVVKWFGTCTDINAQKEFERVREEFLASTAHDLKTPLTTIKGTAQLLRRDVLKGEIDAARITRGLEQVDETATRLARQIDGLLDLARMQAGEGLTLQLQTVDLVALLADKAQRYANASPIHPIRTHATTDRLLVRCDEERLRRVIANLISNAIKYSPAGGEITMTVAEEQANGRTWAVWRVADRGLGIPSGEEQAILEGFHRGSNVAGRIPGAGIGLAGARRMLEEQGGTLEVANREGGGAVFTIRLPLPVPA